MNKKQKQMIVILLTAMIAFSVCVFCIPLVKDASFWVAYTAELLAFALQIPVFKLAYDNAHDLKSKVLGFPVFRVGYIYLGVQTAVSIAVFALSTAMDGFPLWLTVPVCVLILAAAFICSIAADIARTEVQKIEYAQKKDTAVMKDMRAAAQNILSRAYDDDSRHLLELLAESFKYSDPVSSQETYNIEQSLKIKLTELDKTVSDKNNITDLCAEISGLLKNRNEICKMSKK